MATHNPCITCFWELSITPKRIWGRWDRGAEKTTQAVREEESHWTSSRLSWKDQSRQNDGDHDDDDDDAYKPFCKRGRTPSTIMSLWRPRWWWLSKFDRTAEEMEPRGVWRLKPKQANTRKTARSSYNTRETMMIRERDEKQELLFPFCSQSIIGSLVPSLLSDFGKQQDKRDRQRESDRMRENVPSWRREKERRKSQSEAARKISERDAKSQGMKKGRRKGERDKQQTTPTMLHLESFAPRASQLFLRVK